MLPGVRRDVAIEQLLLVTRRGLLRRSISLSTHMLAGKRIGLANQRLLVASILVSVCIVEEASILIPRDNSLQFRRKYFSRHQRGCASSFYQTPNYHVKIKYSVSVSLHQCSEYLNQGGGADVFDANSGIAFGKSHPLQAAQTANMSRPNAR